MLSWKPKRAFQTEGAKTEEGSVAPDVIDGVTEITEEENVRIRGKTRRPLNDFPSNLVIFVGLEMSQK